MNAIQFIQQHGVEKSREVVEGAPDGCTHYRLFSCGAKYTKHVSISECYIWNGIMWRVCSAPDLVFTSGVIHSISELKQALQSYKNNEIRLFRRYDINDIKNMLETVPEGATHVTDDFRMFINEHFDHLEAIKNQIPVLASISDLKRLVESIDLIEFCGGIDIAKELDCEFLGENYEAVKQAIADYELIYSNDMGDDTHIENHVSPNCKVGVK